ncbi:MAG: hypothetical protein E7812_17485 [Phenylobacterium sp.]|nr:MAG: hypothetical protein E7812_17485 [Phenylobacterium sp.]
MTQTTERPGLTPDQRRAFDARGLVKLPGAVSRRAAAEMADRLWAELVRKDGIERDRPATWRTERVYGFQALQATGAFKPMASPAARAALDDLLGAGWIEPTAWGQPLVCFPIAQAWNVPRQGWHLDGPADPQAQRRMIGRLFVILAPLAARGGTTLVATGSHRIVMALADAAGVQLSSGKVRKRLQEEHAWFGELIAGDEAEDRIARFMEAETEVSGVPLRLEAMTGEPGDAWLMHPNILHTGSPNALDAPRLVLSQFVQPKVG